MEEEHSMEEEHFIEEGRLSGIQRLLKEPLPTGRLLQNLRLRLEDMDAKAAYLLTYRQPAVEETIARGEAAFQGMLVLPGTGGGKEFVGDPPCWLERRHNDNEFLWQLNRMTHWQDLLEAFSLTKDGKYAKKVTEELRHWIRTVKVPEDLREYPLSYFSECHPHRALEIGIRAYKTWPLVMEHLGRTEYFTEELLEQYLEAVYRQIRALRRVSPQLWPKADHNHFLMECLGVLTTALYFPELKEAEEWRSFAIDGIERCAAAQLTEAGGQIEGCPSYHNGCMFWFGLALQLSRRFGFTFSEEYRLRYRKNLDYSIYSMRPTGKCVPAGDSHANYLASMAGIYGYLALGELTWLGLAANFMDRENIYREADRHAWRALDIQQFYKELQTLEKGGYHCYLPRTFYNRELGQAIFRSGWSRDALSFFMTCRSPVQNAHAHIDLMSFDFTGLGKNMVCDPGIFCYREDEDRRRFKSTAYHSTVVIDDKDQFAYEGSFAFGPQKKGSVFRVEERDFYQVASASHFNYEPVVHYRHMALVEGRFLLVADVLTSLKENHVKGYFHLDYTDVQVWGERVEGRDAKANLALYRYPYQKISLLPGQLSDTNDRTRPAVRVLYEGRYSGEQCFLTLLVPYKGEITEPVELGKLPGEGNVYEVTYGETYRITVEKEDMIIAKSILKEGGSCG